MAVRKSRYRPPSERGKAFKKPRQMGRMVREKAKKRVGSAARRKEEGEPPRRPSERRSSEGTIRRSVSRRRQERKRELVRNLCLGGGFVCMVLSVSILLFSVLGRGKMKASSVAAQAKGETVQSGEEIVQMQPVSSVVDMDPKISFRPHATEKTRPENLILSTQIEVDGVLLPEGEAYHSPWEISFGYGEEYALADGLFSFRGDNFRNSPSVGYASLSEGRVERLWDVSTGSLTYQDAYWSGSGWTGQPLMRHWTKEERERMNLYPWARDAEDLVEVIYACMDGYVYFLDLATGRATRDALYLGYTFKGAGALDPRGYPLMYLGAGYDSVEGTAHAFIISLIDCSVLYTFGEEDPFSLRGHLSYFDSSALVDAETDTLIYPGENGILYLFHLNTQYDPQAGTISVSPDRVVKWRYNGVRTDWSQYWLGMEDSAIAYQGYLFVADNGGNLMCLDLNTLELIWVADVLDDSNSTPILAVEDGHLFLYISTSFHLGWRSSDTASVPIWKIDAETGEVVWQTEYECYSEEEISGGVLSTPAVGKGSLSDYVYVTVARTGGEFSGVLTCLNR